MNAWKHWRWKPAVISTVLLVLAAIEISVSCIERIISLFVSLPQLPEAIEGVFGVGISLKDAVVVVVTIIAIISIWTIPFLGSRANPRDNLSNLKTLVALLDKRLDESEHHLRVQSVAGALKDWTLNIEKDVRAWYGCQGVLRFRRCHKKAASLLSASPVGYVEAIQRHIDQLRDEAVDEHNKLHKQLAKTG